MTRCIAFLRAVSVGGRFVKMADLGAAFERTLKTCTTFRNITALRRLVETLG